MNPTTPFPTWEDYLKMSSWSNPMPLFVPPSNWPTLTRTASSLPATSSTTTVQTPTTPDPSSLTTSKKEVFCSYTTPCTHLWIPESCYGSSPEDQVSMESVPPLTPFSSSSLVSEHLTCTSSTLANSPMGGVLSSLQNAFQKSQIGSEPRVGHQSVCQPDTITECSRTTPLTSAVMLNRLIVSNTQTTEKESSRHQSPAASQGSSSADSAGTSPSPSSLRAAASSPIDSIVAAQNSSPTSSGSGSPLLATTMPSITSPRPGMITSSVEQPPSSTALSSPHPAPSTSSINFSSSGSPSHSRALNPSGSMNWSGPCDIPDTIPLIDPTPDYQSERELQTYRTKRARTVRKIQIPAPLVPGTTEYQRMYLAALKNAKQSALYKDPKLTLRSSLFDPHSGATLPQQVKYPMGAFVCYRSWRRSQGVKLEAISEEWDVIGKENGAELKEWTVRASNLLNEHYAQLRAGYIVVKQVDGKKKKVEKRFGKRSKKSDEKDKEEDDDLDA